MAEIKYTFGLREMVIAFQFSETNVSYVFYSFVNPSESFEMVFNPAFSKALQSIPKSVFVHKNQTSGKNR